MGAASNLKRLRDSVNERLDRVWAPVQSFIDADKKKLGGLHAGAMWRLGLAELREVFSPGGNIAQQTPYGIAGTKTPGEVYSDRKDAKISKPVMNDRNVRIHSTLEKGKEMDTTTLPTPSEIAAANDNGVHGQDQGNVHGQDQGNVHGQDQGSVYGEHDSSPSPSDIAANPEPYVPEQQQGHEQDHGMDM